MITKLKKKDKIEFGIIIAGVLVLAITVFLIKYNNRPRSMYATHCNKITIQTEEKQYSLNIFQRKKLLKLCENNLETVNYIVSDDYDVIIDFHNDIIKLYVDTDRKGVVGLRYAPLENQWEPRLYFIASQELIDYINKIITD